MESNMAGFVLNASALESMYNQAKDDGFIDLGLSLKTLHTQSCYPIDQSSQSLHVNQTIVSDGYNEPVDWTYLRSVHLKSPKCSGTNQEDCAGEDLEGVQSKERWGYVKVNMEGIVVGRKISLADHVGYPSLALQLEDMFGGLTAYGLRLFQCRSEFVLVYKDREEKWWSAGDVPWKEFVDCAKRLRIVRKKKVSIS
ncbi:auxin-responsive protein IAA32 [Beta vulgaris subsp. vulgaris]|uniref:auxin-responsive protein IAA32 n=1 Tax=Beta vulgaris subsp. vulgaris TaxID=3555 RepID=UPI0020370266|nr:auxin-responsive protein IAA32 [Beta vulgaris subsp. vulgaris]